MSTKINFHRVLLVAGLTALVIIYAVLWAQMISSPAERTGADFIAFYAAGQVARTEGLARVYDPALQQAVQEDKLGFTLAPGQVLLYNHIPYLVPLVTILSDGDYAASFLRWVLTLVAVFAVAVSLLTDLLRRSGWEKANIRLAWLGMILFYPLFVSLLNGQDTAFTTLGLCLWLYGLLTGRDWLAGLGLALVTVRPHIAGVVALPFLFRRQKVFWWFCAGAAALGLLSLLMVGWDGIRGFLDLLRVSAGGEFYGMHESAMINLVGLLTRLFPDVDAQLFRWVGWGAYFAALVSLCGLWARSRVLDERHYSQAVVLALFFAPHLHYHDLALLLVPLLALMLTAVRGGSWRTQDAGPVPLAASFLLVCGSLLPALKFNAPYLVMVFILVGVWFPQKFFFRRQKQHEVVP